VTLPSNAINEVAENKIAGVQRTVPPSLTVTPSPTSLGGAVGGALLMLLLCGCASYQFGNATLFNPNIRTVHVPVVRNDTFRHDIGVQLTEAIVKAIEQRTPYKVVANPNADSVLSCRISNEAKRVVTETVNDDPRVLNQSIAIEMTWTDRSGNLLLTNRFLPPGEVSFYFIQGSEFIPEGGQSIGTAQHQIVQSLADQIVNQMESRW
jgi:hypothetical protein